MNIKSSYLKLLLLFMVAFAWSSSDSVCKLTRNPETIGQVLCNIKISSFTGIFKLIFVIAYVSGTGLLVAAIFKLKQVKDNPTQIPVSTPIVLFLCAALSIFMPELIAPAGETIFGSAEGAPTVRDASSSTNRDASKIGVPSIANLMQEG